MTKLWDHYKQWKLRLMNDGHQVDEVMCDGAPPAIGGKVFYETFADSPDMVRRTTAVVTAQDACIDYYCNCYLLVIARVESSGVFPWRDDG